jgi:hypothetical protein
MKLSVRDMAMMALGMGAVVTYQKYNKPMMNEAKKMVHKASNTLEDMM